MKLTHVESWPNGYVRLYQLMMMGWLMCLLGLSPATLLTTQAAPTAQTELSYAKGVLEYGNRNYLDALAHLREAIQVSPDHADAHFYVGLCFFRMGEFQEAIEALKTSLRLDSTKRYIHHHLGTVYVKMQRYEEALAQFQLAEQVDATNSDTQFYLGYTHYQLKQYGQSHPYLRRAGELNPVIAPSSHYYQGLAFYATHQDDEARDAFTLAAHTDPTAPLANQAERYLDALDHRAREQRRFRLQAYLGFEYDDNVILEPNDDVLEFGKQSDGRTVFGLSAQFFPIRTSTWHLGTSYHLFQSLHFDLNSFDVQSHTGELFAKVNTGKTSLRASVSGNITLLDFEHFSTGVTLQPSLLWQQMDTLFAEFSLSYNLTDYRQKLSSGEEPSVRDRDGSLIRVGVRQFVLFNQKQSSFELSYHFEASRNDGSDWEYDSHNIGMGFQTPLWWKIKLSIDGDVHWRDYRHVNSFDAEPLGELSAADQRKRQDDRLVGSLSLSRPIGSYLQLAVSYVHTENLSNLALFDYGRDVVSVQLTGRY